MATNPDALFADLIPGAHGATAPVYGAPAADKSKDAPSGYRFRPDGSLEPIPGGPADPNKDVPTVGASQVTGGAYLKTLDPGTASLVQALADGRKSFPSGSALRSPYWQQMLTHVSNYDPGFDEVNYTSRAATRRDFTSGKAANNIRALNTAIGHLGHLEEQVGGTASHGFVPLNAVENFALRATGDPGPTNFDATVSALAGELTAVYRGAGGAEADINRYIQQLSPNASKEQKEGTIRNIVGLLKSRLDALNDQYRQGMGTTAQQLQLLDPQAQLIVHNLGGFDAAGAPEGGAGPGGPSGGGSGGDNGGGPLGMSELSADQKNAYSAFLAANPKPSGEQVGAFLTKLTGKTVTNGDDIAKAIASGQGVSTSVHDSTEQQKVDQRIAEENKLGLNENPAEVLTKQGATLNLSDEAAGVGNALSNVITAPFTGKFDPVGSYTLGRDVERQRIANAREQLGYGGSALEFAGALASANPEGALATLAPKAAAVAAGKVGAAGGALAGFGAGEGAEQSLTGAGVGAASGYALGRYGPGALQKVLPRGARPALGMDPALGQAAAAEDVRISQPMIQGNRAAAVKAGRLEADPSTANYVQQGFKNTASDIESGVNRLGQGGTVQDRGSMGETLRAAAKDIQRVDREGSTAAYDAAREVQPDAMVDPAEIRSRVDAKLAQLQRRPSQNREQILELKRYRADLDKPLPLQEIRDMRTDAYDNVSGLNIARTSAAKKADRFMMTVIDGARKDIENALTPEALAAWQKADAQFADNQKLYRQALKPILGDDFDKLSGEAIFDRVKAAANNNGRALAGFHRRLTTEQSRDLAATLAEGLGRRGPDDEFSPLLFMQQARRFSPSARETLFGPSGKASFDNLLLLSRRLKMAQSEINQSKTARPVVAALRQKAAVFLTGLLTGGGAIAHNMTGAGIGMAVGMGGMAAGAVRRGLSAKALMNPRVTRWMADAADVETPQQARELTRRLGSIIAREPTVANDLQPIYDFLTNRVSPPLAANPQTETDNEQQ